MKKISVALCAIAVGAVLAFGLVACGGSSSSSSDSSSTSSSNSSATYKIATDTTFAPFEFQDASGNYEGIDVEILKAIADDQGFTYDLEPLGFDAALQAVQAGQDDAVIAGMTITDERAKVFDFSTAYYQSGVVMAVASDSNISSYEDLKGKTVAVKKGTMGADYAASIKDKYDFTTTTFSDSPTMYQDVKAGNTVACFEDYPVMGYAISQNVGLKMVGGKKSPNEYGFAVKKGKNAELLQKFNAGLKNIKKNGTYQQIVDKYVKTK